MNRYIAFLKAFERNSFSDAARDLGYTQSAVSQMIKSLEAELGVTLLVRSRSGVTLTYEGRHLLPYIRDTVNAYRMLQSQAAGFSGLEQGTIRLGTFTSVSSFLLPPAMERFRRQHSRIRFELYQGLYYEIEDWVREGVVDFGFTDMSRTTPFACEPIYQDTMLAVLPEGHPLGENIFVQIDELAAEPFILLEEGTNSDPSNVDFVIPANDDATKSVEVILDACCGAIAEGLEERKAEKVDMEAAGENAPKGAGKKKNTKARMDKAEEEAINAAKAAAFLKEDEEA